MGGSGRLAEAKFATIEDAQNQVRACLRKRATAPRRIGVAHHRASRRSKRKLERSRRSTINFAGGFVLDAATSTRRLTIMPSRYLSKTMLMTGSFSMRRLRQPTVDHR